MPKYHITMLIGATTGIEVEAETPEAAIEMAFESDKAQPTICHQCSNVVEIGEVYDTIVYDEDFNEIKPSRDSDNETK